ncbi:MAG: LysM peptidoglycan-binding domain-containing protein [Verrucomicrobiae bacterium]|nr:LysM peptidoglycan-binding domain-containing protein [Verrucomicrobiae bacterium]
MKSSSRQRRIRPLKAKAATADSAAEFDNYGAEPNMKLSHAFMVVLALHVVAVGGLFAFNKVKAGHSKVSEKLQTEVAAGQAAVVAEETKPLVPPPVHEMAKVAEVPVAPMAPSKPQEQVIPIAPKKLNVVPKIVAAPVVPAPTATKSAFLATKTAAASTTVAPVAASSAVAAVANMASSTATAAPVSEPVPSAPAASTEYTIVKGDNPYKIAKRFHVSYDQLIKFNNISDPRKMQIGQKIRIPARGAVKSKG